MIHTADTCSRSSESHMAYARKMARISTRSGALARQVRIPTHPVGRSDNIRSVIPEYPVT